MKSSILISAIVLSLGAGAAVADSLSDNPPKSTTICLNGIGAIVPATCNAPASRLNAQENFCNCHGATLRVKAPVCAHGVQPPSTTAAYERARLAAVRNGSLMDAQWQGQPMCVAPRNRGDY
jgi:hypothetical protein